MHEIVWRVAALSLIVASCAQPPAFVLPADRIERAAVCGAVAWTDLSAADNGRQPSPASVLRVLHYTLLAFDDEEPYDAKTADAVAQLIVKLHSEHADFPSQARAACAKVFPAATVADPQLPGTPLDGTECMMLMEYARRRLNVIGMHAAAADYDRLQRRFKPYVELRRTADVLPNGGVGAAWRKAALIGAAHLGQPAGVIEACRANVQKITSTPDKTRPVFNRQDAVRSM